MANEEFSLAPVNGIVQPPVIPPPDKIGRKTNQLQFISRTVLKAVLKHRYCWPFLEPVDTVRLNLPDYHNIIKSPMDLNTIKKRLENFWYFSAAECQEDFKTIFRNCFLYNNPNSDVAIMAEELGEFFNKKISTMPYPEVEIPVPNTVKYGNRRTGNGAGRPRGRGDVSTPASVISSKNEASISAATTVDVFEARHGKMPGDTASLMASCANSESSDSSRDSEDRLGFDQKAQSLNEQLDDIMDQIGILQEENRLSIEKKKMRMQSGNSAQQQSYPSAPSTITSQPKLPKPEKNKNNAQAGVPAKTASPNKQETSSKRQRSNSKSKKNKQPPIQITPSADSEDEELAKPMSYDKKQQLNLDINKLPAPAVTSSQPHVASQSSATKASLVKNNVIILKPWTQDLPSYIVGNQPLTTIASITNGEKKIKQKPSSVSTTPSVMKVCSPPFSIGYTVGNQPSTTNASITNGEKKMGQKPSPVSTTPSVKKVCFPAFSIGYTVGNQPSITNGEKKMEQKPSPVSTTPSVKPAKPILKKFKYWNNLAPAAACSTSTSYATDALKSATETSDFGKFKKQAEENAEKGRRLQREIVKQKKEKEERERLRVQREEHRKREEQDALEKAENLQQQKETVSRRTEPLPPSSSSASSSAPVPSPALEDREELRRLDRERRRQELRENQIDLNYERDLLQSFEEGVIGSRYIWELFKFR